jgi:hypothetical protein
LRKKLLAAFLMVVMLVGCKEEAAKEPIVLKDHPVYEKTEIQNDVKMTLRVKGNTFKANEEIQVYASAENLSEDTIVYYAPNPCTEGFRIHLVDPKDRRFTRYFGSVTSKETDCLAVEVPYDLFSKQNMETRNYFVSNVPIGEYVIEAFFDRDDRVRETVSIGFPITITE